VCVLGIGPMHVGVYLSFVLLMGWMSRRTMDMSRGAMYGGIFPSPTMWLVE